MSQMGQSAKNSRKTLTSELPPITDMVWPRGNAVRQASEQLLVNRFRFLEVIAAP